MKTQASQVPPPPPAFTPVKLEITFETQAELDAFAALFNQTAVSDAWQRTSGNAHRLGESGYDKFAKPLKQFGVNPSGPKYDDIREYFRRYYAN